MVKHTILLLALASMLPACDGAGTSAATSSASGSTGSGGSTSSTGSGGAGGAAPTVDRGPTRIPVDGDPNGLWWDPKLATLYLADSDNNRVLKWTDEGGIALVSELPKAPPMGPGLGQLVKTKTGVIVVTRFGFGTDGDVVYIGADTITGKVPNLDPERRRIGLTLADDGSLYDTYFVQKAGADLGVVAKLDLKGGETDVLGGLDKPIGVFAAGTDLFISDQGAGTVLKAPLASPDKIAVFAMLDGPDLLCAGPAGSIFTGGNGGDVRQIAADGEIFTLATGFHEVRGVAYDALNKRLFLSDHDAGGSMNAVQIVPVD